MWQELAADTTLVPSPGLPASATAAPLAHPRAGRCAPLPSWGSAPELGLQWGRPPVQGLSQTLAESCSPGHSAPELGAAGHGPRPGPGPEDQVAPCSPLPTPVTSCLGATKCGRMRPGTCVKLPSQSSRAGRLQKGQLGPRRLRTGAAGHLGGRGGPESR